MFVAALQKIFGMTAPVPVPQPVVRYERSARPVIAPARPVRAASRATARVTSKPLRIVRHDAGRMVISGRMADVCAELDRLAAMEAQALAPAR